MIWLKATLRDNGTVKKDNYDWSVGVNELELASGVIKGHQRAKGWLPVLRKVVRLAKKAGAHVVVHTSETTYVDKPAQLELDVLEGPRE